MRRYLIWSVAAIMPALAAALIIGFTGCGGGTKPDDDDDVASTKPKGKSGGSTQTPVEGAYTGTLNGKVTFVGDKPPIADLTAKLQDAMKAKDEAHCLASGASEEEKSQQTWLISPDGRLGNVFVWIVPPKGKFFKVDMNNKTWEDRVELKQPHCAFIKHCFVLFPEYYDETAKKKVPTGQQFVVTNTSPMNHNTKIEGGFNEILPSGKELAVESLTSKSMPISIACDIHTWMNAYAGVFDHPYATVTKPDGTYEIKNVPVGADVRIIAWHEKARFLNSGGGNGEEIKLEAKSTKDFTAKVK